MKSNVKMEIENNMSRWTFIATTLSMTLHDDASNPIQVYTIKMEHCLSIVCLSSGGLFLDLGILDLGFILLASKAIIDLRVSDMKPTSVAISYPL